MSDIRASRRKLLGSGAALLILTPFAAGPAKAAELDADLINLCGELDYRQSGVERLGREDHDDDTLDDALDDWWNTVDNIASIPARTPEGVRAKAGAVRTAIVGTFGDDCDQVTTLLASLLTDMLGEKVDLP